MAAIAVRRRGGFRGYGKVCVRPHSDPEARPNAAFILERRDNVAEIHNHDEEMAAWMDWRLVVHSVH